jgi:hypothetical protein
VRAIDGPKGFTSGKPVNNNSFLHTFDEEGVFCVVSEGARGKHCLINVMKKVEKTETPRLTNQESSVVIKGSKIVLTCDTPDSIIHYTLDGSMPSKKSPKYDNEIGVIMCNEGINIIRAIAYSDQRVNSAVFTSR